MINGRPARLFVHTSIATLTNADCNSVAVWQFDDFANRPMPTSLEAFERSEKSNGNSRKHQERSLKTIRRKSNPGDQKQLVWFFDTFYLRC